MQLKRVILILLTLVTLGFSTNVRNLLVIKATKSTLEADDLVTIFEAQGISTTIERIDNYQLVVMTLPKEEDKAISTISFIKRDYPEAFRLYLPKAEEQIDIDKIVTNLRQNREGIAIDYLKHVPKEDLPIWGTLLILMLLLFATLIKAYTQRRSIFKLQDKLSMRQEETEKSISKEKQNIEARRKSNTKEGD